LTFSHAVGVQQTLLRSQQTVALGDVLRGRLVWRRAGLDAVRVGAASGNDGDIHTQAAALCIQPVLLLGHLTVALSDVLRVLGR